jgi:homoserine dehydrogenase
MTEVRVGLLGCGTVGGAVARRLLGHDLSARAGARVSLGRVAVRDAGKARPVTLPYGVLTTNARCVATDLGVDVVVEATSADVATSYDLVAGALAAGKPVVTANKQLLAAHGPLLDAIAAVNGVELRYEASVCGAVPIVRVLRQSLAGDRVRRVEGILNGTTNYVLSALARGASFGAAVAEAQRLGYAEADPSDDLSGRDAAAKAVLLARAAFGVPVSSADVAREGVGEGTEALVRSALRDGGVVRSVATIEPRDGGLHVSVAPAVLAPDHPLAAVDGVENAVVVDTECAGQLVLTGRGAGGDATASAVLGDLVSAVRRLVEDSR